MQDLGSGHKALLLTHRHLCFSVTFGCLLGWRWVGGSYSPVGNKSGIFQSGRWGKTKNALSHPAGPLHPHTQCILQTVLPGCQTWTKNPRQAPSHGCSFLPAELVSPFLLDLPMWFPFLLWGKPHVDKVSFPREEPHTRGFPNRRRLGLIVRGAQGCRENVSANKTEKLAALGLLPG